MERFQIRDQAFGLTVRTAEDSVDALLQYFADKRRGELKRQVSVDEQTGVASVTVDGETFTAVPITDEV